MTLLRCDAYFLKIDAPSSLPGFSVGKYGWITGVQKYELIGFATVCISQWVAGCERVRIVDLRTVPLNWLSLPA